MGTGADVGIHRQSTWNNPEPEIVLAVGAMVLLMLGAFRGERDNPRRESVAELEAIRHEEIDGGKAPGAQCAND